MIECHVVDTDMDDFPGFSGNLFTTLVYDFEGVDVGMGLVVGFTVDINFTGYMSTTFFHSMFWISAELTTVQLTANLFRIIY